MIGKTMLAMVGAVIVGMIAFAIIPPVDGNTVRQSPMIAGQDWDDPIGMVSVILGANDFEGYLFVEYAIDSDEDWFITETNLAVEEDFDDIPQTKSGNPKIGHFEYNEESEYFWDDDDSAYYANAPSPTTIVYKIPLYEEGDHDWGAGDTLYFAAHSVVENDDGGEETSWADTGYSFPGSSWALYFMYTFPV